MCLKVSLSVSSIIMIMCLNVSHSLSSSILIMCLNVSHSLSSNVLIMYTNVSHSLSSECFNYVYECVTFSQYMRLISLFKQRMTDQFVHSMFAVFDNSPKCLLYKHVVSNNLFLQPKLYCFEIY